MRATPVVVIVMVVLAGCGSTHAPGDGDVPDAGAPDGTVTGLDASVPDLDGSVPGPDGSVPGPDGSPPDDAAIPAGPCIVGTAIACGCASGPPGFRYCLERSGSYSVCECESDQRADAGPDASAGCVPGDDEWCDGRDNDCDAIVDEGYVCPDSTIAHTSASDLVVYARGVRSEDTDAHVIQRLWPTSGPLRDIPEAWSFVFDDAERLHYMRAGVGARRYVGIGPDVELATPPCFNLVQQLYGFDGDGNPYYACDGTIRRGAGELVNDTAFYASGVLAGGAFVQFDSGGVAVLDASGAELGRFDSADWVGALRALRPITVFEDSAFVAFDRTFRGTSRREVVIVRLDGDGTVGLVRRIPTPQSMASGVALPDGHYIGLRYDASRPETGLVFDFPPAGPASVMRDNRDSNALLFPFRRSTPTAFIPAPPGF